MKPNIMIYLIESISIINRNIYLIILFGLSSIFIFTGKSLLPSTILLVLSFIIEPLVFGRFAELVMDEKHESYFAIFNKHWINYYVVLIILFSPIILINFFVGETTSWKTSYGIKSLLIIIMNVFGIYIFPIIFLYRERLKSIFLGIKYLISKFRYSLLLVLITISISLLNAIIRPLLGSFYYGNFILWVFISLFVNFIFAYAKIIVFITSAKILEKEGENR